ncbi:uncharacterized protein TRIVIDRAFT_70099 [Trichoderma virens Gv29-8]|uniref:Cadmium resistance transporter n=1 Tax=Hypocrea virens (strain Gv29-8 / FGSC 10586) TaxID=413071 RepID=G9NDT8_HYPVG|nr:uncharacterized protein TRIVIDRAFT_70099 [Trichoderma virens Gv29-8]EHK15188.1 hypothetical protein TRIVIDRAFT_70099 [Trichoderma virens Gv29-8]UKZ58025.1 hypothetical protein TrVGV298_011886 [Trichoderma virens]
MQFGATIGEACATFAITNIDDLFVLVTFNAEAATSKVMTPFRIAIGQFIGFTVIIAISMIGFGVSLVLPPEPIGFLGLLPILLGIWKFCHLFFPESEEDTEISTAASLKGIFKVALITVMNGGDNIGTYIPLFAQVERAAIAVYIVVYYILLAVWCLAASLIMRQKHILALVQKYVDYVIPLLYTGLGIFIIVKSNCYPWTIQQIDKSTGSNPGEGTMAGVTTFILLASTCAMAWATVAKRKIQNTGDVDLPIRDGTNGTPQETATRDADVDVHRDENSRKRKLW